MPNLGATSDTRTPLIHKNIRTSALRTEWEAITFASLCSRFAEELKDKMHKQNRNESGANVKILPSPNCNRTSNEYYM